MKLGFTKMHGLGNDFILIDGRIHKFRHLQSLSRKLCGRRFGIGADQLLYLCNSTKADYRMRIFNADGSEVEMCGNGIRCLAKFIWESGITPVKLRKASVLNIETIAGIIRPSKSDSMIRVDMGEPIFESDNIPLKLANKKAMVINFPLKIKNRTYKFTALSMGNPHAVTVVKETDGLPVEIIGPIVENHNIFPSRTNVEFIQIINRGNIKIRVWERGVGETMACGTGASAASVASSLLGLTNRKVNVHLSGGNLLINWSVKDNHVYMTGPAEKVFEGKIEI